MRKLFNDFKEFALKGNAIALAVGVVMGAAFNAIINAIVTGILTPLVGVLLGGLNLATETFTIAGVTFGWGAVLDATINFLCVALALFLVVEVVSRFDKEPDPTTRECPFCTTEIDLRASRCPACTSTIPA